MSQSGNGEQLSYMLKVMHKSLPRDYAARMKEYRLLRLFQARKLLRGKDGWSAVGEAMSKYVNKVLLEGRYSITGGD